MLPNCDKSAAQKGEFGYRASSATENLDVEVAYFLAQGIAVDPQQVRGTDLIAARGREGRGQQRMLDLAQNAMIQAGGRKPVLELGKVSR